MKKLRAHFAQPIKFFFVFHLKQEQAFALWLSEQSL
jgi:hypothetical protein